MAAGALLSDLLNLQQLGFRPRTCGCGPPLLNPGCASGQAREVLPSPKLWVGNATTPHPTPTDSSLAISYRNYQKNLAYLSHWHH